MKSVIFSLDGKIDLLGKIMSELLKLRGSIYTKEDEEAATPTIGEINIETYSDAEVCPDLLTSVRGKRVYFLISANSPQKILLLNFAIDAAKRAAAKEIIAILPYFPYARQDKKDQTRGPIGAKVMAEMLEQRGVNQVITFDLHADQIQGFFNIPVTHMEGKYLFDNYIYECWQKNNNLVLCTPDAGGAKRVKRFRDHIKNKWGVDLPIVMIDKTRKEANVVDNMVLIGDVKNKDVIIIDDMCDTAGTLVKACDKLIEEGGQKIYSVVTHGVLSGKAYDNLFNSNLEEFVCSDSLIVKEGMVGNCNIRTISVAEQIALAIMAINKDMSVDALKHAN